MGKYKKCLALATVIALSLILLLTSCTKDTTTAPSTATTTSTAATSTLSTSSTTITSTNPFTQEQLKQILLDAQTVMAKAGTYKLDIDMSSNTSFDNQAATTGTSMKATLTLDIPQNQLMMSFIMNITSPDTGEATTEAELYSFTDFIYMKLNIPNLGTQWVKVPANQEILDTFSANMMQKEMNDMELPSSVEFIKYETIRGTDCYVLKYIPSDSSLRQNLENYLPQGMKINWDKLSSLSSIYKDMSYKVWIGKQNKYIYKMEVRGAVVFTSDFAELEGVSFNKATTDIAQTMDVYDINAAVSIVLPAEAENAVELSPDMLLGK
jgi:hypothetical protein